jgi:hypothetical protein
VVSFTPRPLYPRERAPGTHWIGGWVGSGAVLDAVVKRKIPSLCWESNPRTPTVQPVAQSYTDWAITALLTDWVISKSVTCCVLSSSLVFFFFRSCVGFRGARFHGEQFWEEAVGSMNTNVQTSTYESTATYQIPKKIWNYLTWHLTSGKFGRAQFYSPELQAGWSGVRAPAEAGNFFSTPCPERLWDPLRLLSNGYQGLYSWG